MGPLSSGVKRGRGVMLTTHHLPVPRLRKSRSYTSCHPDAPVWGVTGPLYLIYIYIYICVCVCVCVCIVFNSEKWGKAVYNIFIGETRVSINMESVGKEELHKTGPAWWEGCSVSRGYVAVGEARGSQGCQDVQGHKVCTDWAEGKPRLAGCHWHTCRHCRWRPPACVSTLPCCRTGRFQSACVHILSCDFTVNNLHSWYIDWQCYRIKFSPGWHSDSGRRKCGRAM
jgi:hypothetical protein